MPFKQFIQAFQACSNQYQTQQAPAMNMVNAATSLAVQKATEIDTTGWTKHGPTKCECIEAKTGSIKTAGGPKDLIILTFVDLSSTEELLYFLNATKKKSDNYAVPRQSNFAKLYRLTTGKNPSSRFSKAQQLMNHFIGEYFICEYETAKSTKGHCYNKVTSIIPANIQQSDEWLSSGFTRKKRRQINGNNLEKNWQIVGNQLETEISEKPRHIWRQLPIQSHNNIATSRVSTYQHAPMGTDVKVINEREVVINYRQLPDETDDQYLDRVIDESWNWREA